MTRTSFVTIRTSVSVDADTEVETARAFNRREEELQSAGKYGYVLATTQTIATPSSITFYDTLQKSVEDD